MTMDEYTITVSRSARKELERLDKQVVRRIIEKIEGLSSSPRPPECCKVHIYPGLWRLRAGDYRVIYSIEDERRHVDIIAVRHRGDAYQPR